MKIILSLLLTVTSIGVGRAEEAAEFTVFLSGADVVPPSPTGDTGEGTFTLVGSELSYDILTLANFFVRSQVYGPAEPGMNGPVLFNLQTVDCELPVPGGPGGYCHLQGTRTISEQQAAELAAGLWYVQITSTVFPELAIRGQIVPVPEPSALLLVSLGAGLGYILTRRGRARIKLRQ